MWINNTIIIVNQKQCVGTEESGAQSTLQGLVKFEYENCNYALISRVIIVFLQYSTCLGSSHVRQ